MKIMMVTSSFDIGGAETHILELSRELYKMKNELCIVSDGGDYTKELERENIRHYSLPLNSKNPKKLICAYRGLIKILKEEKFDVIHAHARLPAFICSIVSKKLSIPFVTTSHWVFSLKQPQKTLTRWGEKCLAVSADIKNYLIDNYKVFPENIKVTVNGIDTMKFNKADIPVYKNKIIHVSRLDYGRAKTAFTLIDIAPKIAEISKDITIDIVGGGNCEEEIREKADKVNKICERKIIHIHGKRTDIDVFLSENSGIFVGVSRAALEAMSCSYPVILSGDEGYEGIFDAKNSEKAVLSNFCCRSSEPLNNKTLFEDICELLTKPEKCKRLGKANRKFIENQYSVKRMAQDALSLYESVVKIPDSPAVVICGYYGYGNIGDEATLKETIKELRRQRISEITVLSKSPKRTMKKFGIYAIHRYNFLKIRKAIKKCDCFLLGGGNLLQNQTSNRSLYYYGSMLKYAKKTGARCFCYSCGIGELHEKKALNFVKEVLACCEKVIVRTKNDAKFIKEISENTPVSIACDIVFLYKDYDNSYLSYKFSYLKDKKYAVFALREPRKERKRFINDFSLAIKKLYKEYNIFPVFITMHKKKDEKITRDILNASGIGVLQEAVCASDVVYLLKNSAFASGMRMHLMVFSILAKVPFISISYDTKCSDIYSEIRSSAKNREFNSDFIFREIKAPYTFKEYSDFMNSDFDRKYIEKISDNIMENLNKIRLNIEKKDFI